MYTTKFSTKMWNFYAFCMFVCMSTSFFGLKRQIWKLVIKWKFMKMQLNCFENDDIMCMHRTCLGEQTHNGGLCGSGVVQMFVNDPSVKCEFPSHHIQQCKTHHPNTANYTYTAAPSCNRHTVLFTKQLTAPNTEYATRASSLVIMQSICGQGLVTEVIQLTKADLSYQQAKLLRPSWIGFLFLSSIEEQCVDYQ